MKQYLSFSIGNEEYCIELLQVQEIHSYEEPTKIAGSPDYVKGVVNLRGDVIPVADLRALIGNECVIDNRTTTIFVKPVKQVFGIIVDSVSDVVDVTPADMKEMPTLGSKIQGCEMVGIASVNKRMLIILDVSGVIQEN